MREFNRPRDDGRQHRFKIERGADGAPNVAQGRELLDRARKGGGPGFQFLKQAHVLDGDNRLIGKGLEQFDVLFRKSARLGSAHRDASYWRRAAIHGDREIGANSYRVKSLQRGRRDSRISLDIGHVKDSTFTDDPRVVWNVTDVYPEWWGIGRVAIPRDVLAPFVGQKMNRARRCSAHLRRVTRDGIEYRLHICGRARDDLKDLTGRREFPIPRLQLLEQADVLDGDDGLVREGLQERDLVVGEAAR